jgi:hypothetical protein
MINLKKQDNVADAVNEILHQEALKGNQHKIDANKNNKIDGEDFKILRGEKKVKEEIDMNDRTKDTLVGREKTKQKDDVGPNSNAKVSKFKLKSEETEQIDELSKDTLGSYLDKKKSEYMKGKTQSGSKENAKDIQNMGKAHDKMNKEEVEIEESKGLVLHKRYAHKLGTTLAQKHGYRPTDVLTDRHLPNMSTDHPDAPHGKDLLKVRIKSSLKSYKKTPKPNLPEGVGPTLKQMKERMEEPVLNELINEVMSKDASAGDWIHDFIHSDNPKFAGKSDAKRKEMALAAYYSKKNEEAVNEGLKDMAKKTFKALTGGSDKDHLDRLKKDMYGGSEVKYAAKTLVKHAKDPLGLKKEETETVEEGWDDMVKAAQEKVKSGPKPSGGSGKKEGSRYGGSKQKEKPEQEVKEATDTVEKDSKTGKVKSWMHTGDWKKSTNKDAHGKVTHASDVARRKTEKMSEGKDPNMDAGVGSQPNFVTDSAKPMQHAQSLAKKSLAKMRSDMMAKKSK